MRAANKDLIPVVTPLPPLQAVEAFFGSNTPESARDTLWYLFKAWVNSPGTNRARYTDEDIALFLDQLIDLVGASFQLHQTNRVPVNPPEEHGHD
jgi:hypothetical protein